MDFTFLKTIFSDPFFVFVNSFKCLGHAIIFHEILNLCIPISVFEI